MTFSDAIVADAMDAASERRTDDVLRLEEFARISLTVSRVEQRLGSVASSLDQLLRELAAERPRHNGLHWIKASQGDLVRVIAVDDVCYFQADAGYTNVVTKDATVLIRRSLKALEDGLDRAMFWPIHRSTIVNANAIAGVARDFRGHVSVVLKARAERLPVSESRVHLFRQM
jgi:DNA-binding LytR/AlgR family response regulator